jgi:hypothetical protein
MLNSGHKQPLTNMCVVAVVAMVLITHFVLVSSRFHFYTQKFQLLSLRRAIEDGQRLDWFLCYLYIFSFF